MNVTLTRKHDSASVSVAYDEYAKAVHRGNAREADDVVIIGGVQYVWSSIQWPSSGSAEFSSSKLDVLVQNQDAPVSGTAIVLNSGTVTLQAGSEDNRVVFEVSVDRQGFEGEITMGITDSEGVFSSPSIDNIGADSSKAVAVLDTDGTLPAGNHSVEVSATVGGTTKTRTITFSKA